VFEKQAELQYKTLGRENNATKTTNPTSFKLTIQNQRMAGLHLRGRTKIRDAKQECCVPVPTAVGG
jgi:hypothetical protein